MYNSHNHSLCLYTYGFIITMKCTGDLQLDATILGAASGRSADKQL